MQDEEEQHGQQKQEPGPTAELVLSPPPGAQQPASGQLVPTAKDDSPTKVRGAYDSLYGS